MIGTRITTGRAGGSAESAAAALIAQLTDGLAGAPPALVAVFGSTGQSLGVLASSTQRAFPSAVVLGASTAGEFTEQGAGRGGAVAFALAGDVRVTAGLGRELQARPVDAVGAAAANVLGEVAGYPHRAGLMLLDALAGRGEEATLGAALVLGDTLPLAGGTAADDMQLRATYVALGEDVARDAVVLAVLHARAPFGLGVAHGHAPLSRPLRVTRARGNVVFEIEGRPAWDLWREACAEHAAAAGIDVATERPGRLLGRYEAGLANGAEYKIRAPLGRNRDGSINFACGIPEGAVLRVTESDPERQIASAREAARRACAALGGAPLAGALVFDCACRHIILEERFGEAVAALGSELGGAPFAGYETYGEVALRAGDMSGFHNTTSVVLAIGGGT